LFSYEQDRQQLSKIESHVLELLIRSLETETEILIDSTSNTEKTKLLEIKNDLTDLRVSFEENFNLNMSVAEVMRNYSRMVDDI
jgi:hypothetical protein